MKKIILASTLLLTSYLGFSQTNQGDFMVGGSLGFRTNKNSSNFNLMPNVGYFFARNFAAGANVMLNFEKEGNIRSTNLGLGPFARYYIGQSNFRPFLHGSIGYAHTSYKYVGTDTKGSSSGWYTTLGLGYAAFISQDVAFEGLAAYNYTEFKNASSANGFSLNFGFQVYINQGKMTDLRRGKLQ